jgi:nitronate monooxygenase
MWYNTPAAKILGVQYPILQGPFGGNLSTVNLTATVSNLGGVGGYGAYTLTPGEIIQLNKALRQATDKPSNINLWVSDIDAPDTDLSDDRFETVRALFRPYFEELGLSLPASKPVHELITTGSHRTGKMGIRLYLGWPDRTYPEAYQSRRTHGGTNN